LAIIFAPFFCTNTFDYTSVDYTSVYLIIKMKFSTVVLSILVAGIHSLPYTNSVQRESAGITGKISQPLHSTHPSHPFSPLHVQFILTHHPVNGDGSSNLGGDAGITTKADGSTSVGGASGINVGGGGQQQPKAAGGGNNNGTAQLAGLVGSLQGASGANKKNGTSTGGAKATGTGGAKKPKGTGNANANLPPGVASNSSLASVFGALEGA
jgi:hypothetical protein